MYRKDDFMKIMKKAVKALFFSLLFATSVLFSTLYILSRDVASTYKINLGESFEINSKLPVTAVYNGAKFTSVSAKSVGENYNVDLKLFGFIPFSSTNIEIVDPSYVTVLGNPFGMKLYTQGVLVIEMQDVNTKDGTVNPAKDAGLKIGDYIQSVDGISVECNEDLAEIVAQSAGKELLFKIIRKKTVIDLKIKPVVDSSDNTYHLGVWVRDSSAGIGTLTFYSPSDNVICGLGHGICDEDTGELLKLDSGEMVGASIVAVKKGNEGDPGELKGRFTTSSIADIKENKNDGVYGTLKGELSFGNLTQVAMKQEITDGEAQILCTVSGVQPKLYSCTVKKRNLTYLSKTQNLIVTVTDPELLKATGGIVQGMSGSPIIQNGKLIGAVTHVLIDEPQTGYGIFAENMLKEAQSKTDKNTVKDAS